MHLFHRSASGSWSDNAYHQHQLYFSSSNGIVLVVVEMMLVCWHCNAVITDRAAVCLNTEQDFTSDLYFRQAWRDSRLSFKPRPGIEALYVGAEVSEKIWVCTLLWNSINGIGVLVVMLTNTLFMLHRTPHRCPTLSLPMKSQPSFTWQPRQTLLYASKQAVRCFARWG